MVNTIVFPVIILSYEVYQSDPGKQHDKSGQNHFESQIRVDNYAEVVEQLSALFPQQATHGDKYTTDDQQDIEPQ